MPIYVVWVLVGAVLLGGTTGVIAYFATSAMSGFLVGTAVMIIFFIVVLPNLPQIVNWSKNITNTFKKSKLNKQ